MAKAVLKFSNTTNPDKLIITWSLFSSPTLEIGRKVYNPPHPQRALTVENLAPVMHRFSFYSSLDGVALGTRLLDMDIDCSISVTEIVMHTYVVDRGNSNTVPAPVGTPEPFWEDPNDGDSYVQDNRLIGTKFHIERRGVGRLRADEVTVDNVLGRFTLIGNTFESEDTYYSISEVVVVPNTAPILSSDYLEVVQISSPGNLTAGHHRKILEVVTTSQNTLFSIPAFSSIPITKILVNTHSMTGRYFTIAFSGIEQAKFMGATKNKITLGKGEVIELFFTGTTCLVMRYEGDYRRLGTLIYGRGIEVNTIPLDGSLYNIADYPRLYNDFINLLPPSQIKTMATWDASQVINTITEYPNKGFFAVDIPAGTFRAPDFRNRFVRGLKLSGTDATRLSDFPGGFQMDMVGPHKHVSKSGWFFYGTDAIGNLSSSTSAIKNNANNRTQDGLQDNTGTETITRNIGLIPQIII